MEQNKQTPARRRRTGKPASARKNYASEGDVLGDMPFPADFPATPMKSNAASPAPGAQAPNSKSTKKATRRPRPTNVSTSPGPVRPERRTPPHSATTKFSSAAAFAGANFHASPAPASLPMPSFLRVGSESAVVKGPAKEPSPPASDCESPSPAKQAAVVQVSRDESPLDLLFRADRAEKERALRATSASANAGPDGPFSPPSDEASEPNTAYAFEPIPLRLPIRHAQRGASNNSAVTGAGVRPEAFAMPIHERIRAARTAEPRQQQQPPRYAHGDEGQYQQQLATPQQLDESSEAVKRLLGIGGANPSNSQSVPLQGRTNVEGNNLSLGAGSKGSPQVSNGPASMQIPGSGGAEDWRFRGEHALRQALKLPFPVGGGLDSSSSPRQAGPFPGHA